MKIIYLILAHKNLEQVDLLIASLNHPEAMFILHLDKKVDFDQVKKYQFTTLPNLRILRKRFDINWGGFNMVKATLSLINAALKLKQKAYLVLLSGSDLPIKSPDLIYTFLYNNYGKQYVECFPLPNPRWIWNGGLDRLQYFWFVDKIGVENSYSYYFFQRQYHHPRPYFEDFPPYGGSQWWCVTEQCAAFIVRFLKENKIYEEYFELTLIPDETFFNTLIMNSPYVQDCVNDNLRFIEWEKNSPHPKSLQVEDYPKLICSKALWARKIDSVEVATKLSELLKAQRCDTISVYDYSEV